MLQTSLKCLARGRIGVNEPAHEIMALFVLRKLILQTHMRSHPVELDFWFLVGPFVYFHTACVRTAKALARLRGCAGSPEPSLVAYVVSTIISWAGSNERSLNGFCFYINDWSQSTLCRQSWRIFLFSNIICHFTVCACLCAWICLKSDFITDLNIYMYVHFIILCVLLRPAQKVYFQMSNSFYTLGNLLYIWTGKYHLTAHFDSLHLICA